MGKQIILLSDGTGNAASKVWRSNVWRLFESLDLTGKKQVAFYDDGVGTSSFKPLAILGGVFGYGLKRNVLDIYKFLCANYESADDEIYGFGFSRGAFTIRVVIGLVLDQGLVRGNTDAELYENAKLAYRAYRANLFHTVFRLEAPFRWARDTVLRLFGHRYDQTRNRTVEKIKFLGLWDTVAAYGLPIDEMARGVSKWLFPLELPDRNFNHGIEQACHALSLDDERTTFHPVLWNEKGVPPGQLHQVWFAGVHSNVGGGYPDNSLAHIPLYWIMKSAEATGLKFKTATSADPDTARRSRHGGPPEMASGQGRPALQLAQRVRGILPLRSAQDRRPQPYEAFATLRRRGVDREGEDPRDRDQSRESRRPSLCADRHSPDLRSPDRRRSGRSVDGRDPRGSRRALRQAGRHLECGVAPPGDLFRDGVCVVLPCALSVLSRGAR